MRQTDYRTAFIVFRNRFSIVFLSASSPQRLAILLAFGSAFLAAVGSVCADDTASSVDLTFTTLIIPSDPSGIVSDNFNSNSLNTNLWTFTNPFGLADLSMTGTQAVISLPQGLSHDPWTSNDAARIMQPCNDADFEVEVKFESEVLERYQMQGIMVWQDSGNYLRFDVYSTGSSVQAFAFT